LALAVALVSTACGGSPTEEANPPPYSGPPPLGAPILRTEGEAILDGLGAETGWRWIPFSDTVCTDATLVGDAYQFGTSSTGLAVNWGAESSADVVLFLQGGGACWDFVTCGGARSLGVDKTAEAVGPFGPAEFSANVYEPFPSSWLRRANLPPALRDATVVFIPYCTGDVHGGDRVTTYAPPSVIGYLPPITWHHAGHANVMAFLKRLGATFPSPGKLVVAGSSAGGFGTLVNYPAFRWYWPAATGYLLDDSAPPLVGNAVPASTRAGWYASWNLGEALDRFCLDCRTDLSQGIVELASRYPEDRIALVSHLQDEVIRFFYGTVAGPMDATAFESQLRLLGTSVLDAFSNAGYFFTNSPTATAHATLGDPTQVTTPAPGLSPWVEQLLSDDPTWSSVSD